MAEVLDIFSKKKARNENKITQNIIVDKMERNAIVAGELINL